MYNVMYYIQDRAFMLQSGQTVFSSTTFSIFRSKFLLAYGLYDCFDLMVNKSKDPANI